MRHRGCGVLAALMGCLLGGWSSAALAAPFTGDFVVYRVGTGGATLSTNAAEVFLDEYDANASLLQSLAMPSTVVVGGPPALTASGTNALEGQLNLSTDGRYLMLTGFDKTAGTTNPNTTTPATVRRVVGRVSLLDGSIDTSTALTSAYSSNSAGTIRGAVSTDGTAIWTVGGSDGGIRSTTHGASASTLLHSNITIMQGAEIYGGELFVSLTNATQSVRIGRVGSGLPTSGGQALTTVPGLDWNELGTPAGFVMFDLDPTQGYLGTGLDTIYVADDAFNQVIKLVFNGTEFERAGGILAVDPRGLAGRVLDDGTVELLSVLDNGTNADTIVRYLDTTGSSLVFTPTSEVIVTAATNTRFRGIEMIPEPAGVGLVGVGALLLALRRTRTR